MEVSSQISTCSATHQITDFDFTTDEDSEECVHGVVINIEGCNICEDCGLKLNDCFIDNENYNDCKFISRYYARRNDERSLYIDMEKIGYPQYIIEKANEYYSKIIQNKIYRKLRSL